MRPRRPYGISFDGRPSLRAPSTRPKIEQPSPQQAQHLPVACQPLSNPAPPQQTLRVFDVFQVARPLLPSRRQSAARVQTPVDKLVVTELNYVSKFLDFEAEPQDNKNKQYEDDCDYALGVEGDEGQPVKGRKYAIDWGKKIQRQLYKCCDQRLLERLFTCSLDMNVSVDLSIEAECIFHDFFNLVADRSSKMVLIYLFSSLRQFLEQYPRLERLWVGEFKRFPLCSNIYLSWLQRRHSRDQRIPSILKQAYRVFFQWCHYCKLTRTRVIGTDGARLRIL